MEISKNCVKDYILYLKEVEDKSFNDLMNYVHSYKNTVGLSIKNLDATLNAYGFIEHTENPLRNNKLFHKHQMRISAMYGVPFYDDGYQTDYMEFKDPRMGQEVDGKLYKQIQYCVEDSYRCPF